MSDPVRKALVTGCAGFIGSVLVRQLLARGAEVIGLDDCSRGSEAAIVDLLGTPRFTFIRGDVRSAMDVARATAAKPTAVFHLAARHFIPECAADPAGTYDINVVGTERVWDAARACGAEQFLFMSTGDVYQPSVSPHLESDTLAPFNVYGLSKLTSERSLAIARQAGGPAVTIARMFNVYGGGDRNDHLIPSILRQVRGGARELRLGNLWPVRDYVYVEDAAAALIRLSDVTGADVVNVGTGGGWTVQEVVESIGAALAVPLRVTSVSEFQRPVERDSLRPDVGRLAALTGWRPTRGLAEGLRAFAAAEQR
ncbi:MAG: UDP-glucose 4-epimerase [Acidobacteria bacterium]|nr:UDP-glucose 4-epimerase [Acidobacteriota bacterium]